MFKLVWTVNLIFIVFLQLKAYHVKMQRLLPAMDNKILLYETGRLV